MFISIRKCPECGNDIISKTKSEVRFRFLEKHKNEKTSLCRSCCQRGERNHMFGKTGDKNHFYGKTHSDSSRQQMSNSLKGNTPWNKGKICPQFQGTNNAMYEKSVLDFMIKKYGKDGANDLWENMNKSRSIKNQGKNNPMYGRPAPQHSGNGWKGWYKGWFFRSLRELSYMINVVERFNLKWESAEKKIYRIPYKNENGIDRTYSADFVINDKFLVEIKPTKLMSSPKNKAKKEAAINWCKQNNMVYKISDPKIDKKKILNQYDQIKWLNDDYEKRFLNF